MSWFVGQTVDSTRVVSTRGSKQISSGYSSTIASSFFSTFSSFSSSSSFTTLSPFSLCCSIIDFELLSVFLNDWDTIFRIDDGVASRIWFFSTFIFDGEAIDRHECELIFMISSCCASLFTDCES